MNNQFFEKNKDARKPVRLLLVIFSFIMTAPLTGFSSVNPFTYLLLVSDVLFLYIILIGLMSVMNNDLSILDYWRDIQKREDLINSKLLWSLMQTIIPLIIGFAFFSYTFFFRDVESNFQEAIPIFETILIHVNSVLMILGAYFSTKWIISRFVQFTGEKFETGVLQLNVGKLALVMIPVFIFWISITSVVDLQIIEVYQNGTTSIFGDISSYLLLVIEAIILVSLIVVAKVDAEKNIKNRTNWVQEKEANNS